MQTAPTRKGLVNEPTAYSPENFVRYVGGIYPVPFVSLVFDNQLHKQNITHKRNQGSQEPGRKVISKFKGLSTEFRKDIISHR